MHILQYNAAYHRHFEFFNGTKYDEYCIYVCINIIINTETSRITGEMTIHLPTYIYMGLKNNYVMQMHSYCNIRGRILCNVNDTTVTYGCMQ